MGDSLSFSDIERRIAKDHLRCCGGFYPSEVDGLNSAIETAIIVGNTANSKNSDFWRAFEARRKAIENPLESWTRNVLSQIAKELSAEVIFPFEGPPFIPILTWAQKVEAVYPSPFGPLIHPVYGLWHAYRGVLLFKEKIQLSEFENINSPCLTCTDQPCTSTCPVDAIEDGNFNVEACSSYLTTLDGRDCLQNGCQARRACPIGQQSTYEPAQAQFHQTAFLENYGPKAS